MAVRPIRVLSLFSGAGGLDLAVKVACRDARVICHVEVEAYAASLLVKAMDGGWLDQAAVWSDVRTFDAGPWRGAVDGVVAGFPCPPVSCAGQRKGVHDDRWLWPEVARVVRDVRPRWVFLENVNGLLSANDGAAFRAVLWDLADLGFDAEWTVLAASAVGAPHQRKRVFILGFVADAQCAQWGPDIHGRLDEPNGPDCGWREAKRPSVGSGRHVADAQCAERWPGDGGRGCGGQGCDRQGQATGSARKCRPTLAHADRRDVPGRGVARDVAGEAGAAQGDGPEREWLRDAPDDGGPDVADASIDRWPEGSEAVCGRQPIVASDGDGKLVNPESQRAASAQQPGRPCGVEPSGGPLGHSIDARPSLWSRVDGDAGEELPAAERAGGVDVGYAELEMLGGQPDAPERWPIGGVALDRAGATVGDPQGGGRLQAKRWCPADERPFPPGPSDPGWPDILAVAPWLSPATQRGLRVLDDELAVVVDASRVDQLRCSGNGVVVCQAALALRFLAWRGGVRL